MSEKSLETPNKGNIKTLENLPGFDKIRSQLTYRINKDNKLEKSESNLTFDIINDIHSCHNNPTIVIATGEGNLDKQEKYINYKEDNGNGISVIKKINFTSNEADRMSINILKQNINNRSEYKFRRKPCLRLDTNKNNTEELSLDKKNFLVAPLSGHRLLRSDDGFSTYFKSFQNISQNSLSPLIVPLEKNLETLQDIPLFFKSKISDIIKDAQVWPVVWTCFGQACKVQYVNENFKGNIINLKDIELVEKDFGLKEFQNIWNDTKKFIVMSKEILSPSNALIIISSVANSNNFSRLYVWCPIHHPFFVEAKGWVQVEPRNVYFGCLNKMDIIGHIDDLNMFSFLSNNVQTKPDQQNNTKNEALSLNKSNGEYPSPTHNDEISPQKNNYDGNQGYVNFIDQNEMNSNCIQNIETQNTYNNCYFMQYNTNTLQYIWQQYYDPTVTSRNKTYLDIPDNIHFNKKNKTLKEENSEMTKRPMNGFMLFAKTMRLQLINENPGKDNRIISQILGKRWKHLPIDQKNNFKEQARKISNDRLKLNPNCWKRKHPPKRISRKNDKKSSCEQSVILDDENIYDILSNVDIEDRAKLKPI